MALIPRFKFYWANSALLGMSIALFVIISFSGSARADDVEFGFAAGMGGTGIDEGHGIAVDALGNVYTTGRFSGTVDFNPGAGTFNLTSVTEGIPDIFISKLDSAGNFVWARRIGGTGTDEGLGIALDTTGNVYTTGYFEDTVDFNPGAGTFNLTSVDREDIFISKLDSAGNFAWAKRSGGTRGDRGSSIAVDTTGNVYTTGHFRNTVDFNPGAGTFELTSAGLQDTFVSKLNSAGSFIWARRIGGTRQADGYGISVDESGNVYTTGTFQNTVDFDPGAGTFELSILVNGAGFVQKMDSAGNFLWAKAMLGTDWVLSRGIALDSSSNVYTTGYFRKTVDFDPGVGTFELTSVAGFDIFVTKLDSAGNFLWARTMGGTGDNRGWGIALDTWGNVYTTGDFNGTADFDPGVGTFDLIFEGLDDVFVSRLDSAGNFLWAKAMGSSSFSDRGLGIALDAAGSVYTTGLFSGTVDFDPGAGTVNLTGAGSNDIFVSKLARIENLVETWVDFGFVGNECGSEENPFNLLAEGLAGVDESGTVKIKGNTGDNASSETMTIDQAVTLEAVNGTVRIGDAGSRISDRVGQAGFVSRD